jgi:hypothetical protein
VNVHYIHQWTPVNRRQNLIISINKYHRYIIVEYIRREHRTYYDIREKGLFGFLAYLFLFFSLFFPSILNKSLMPMFSSELEKPKRYSFHATMNTADNRPIGSFERTEHIIIFCIERASMAILLRQPMIAVCFHASLIIR